MIAQDATDFLIGIKNKFPMAWEKTMGDDTDVENLISSMPTTNEDGDVMPIVAAILADKLEKQDIQAYVGRNIKETMVMYKPMIVDVRKHASTITYFLVIDENSKEYWGKLPYEDMAEFANSTHFPGYKSTDDANSVLFMKAFEILSRNLYGQ